ncbi:MAG: thioredoxin family protein [Clostridium sp.]
MRQELIDNIPSESPLVSEELKNQLKTIFDKLDKPLKLVTILEVGDDSCIEMGAFLKAIAPLNKNLELKFLEKGEEPDIDEELNAYMLPVVGLFRGDEYLGAAFHGVPGGQEINSFALAIYHAAGPGQDVDEKTLKKIQKLKKKNNIKVCISLSCHHCPLVVSAGQSIALLSPNVVCEMVDARLYPSLVEKYKISRVPAVIINDSALYMGEKDREELLKLLR